MPINISIEMIKRADRKERSKFNRPKLYINISNESIVNNLVIADPIKNNPSRMLITIWK